MLAIGVEAGALIATVVIFVLGALWGGVKLWQRRQHANSADVMIDREAHYDPRTAETQITIRSHGPRPARDVRMTVTNTSHGVLEILMNSGSLVSSVNRAELQPDEIWSVPVRFPNGQEGFPYDLHLRWEDANGSRERTCQVVASGPLP